MKSGPKPMTREAAVLRALKEAVQYKGCLLRMTKATCGEGYKLIGCEGKGFYAHRLVYEVKSGEKLTVDDVIRHSCDRPNCIEFAHLIKGTHNDNVQDKVNKKRHGFGSKHYAAKLTDEDVRKLRALTKPNFEELADTYLMSVGALKSAYYGHTWRHVES